MFISITVHGGPLKIGYLPATLDFFVNKPKDVKFTCAQKGRRSGFTNSGLIHIADRGPESRKVLWVDTIQANLDKYYERYLLPVLKQFKKKYWHYNKQSHQLNLFDGYVDFRSAERPETLEGYGYQDIYLNEAGIILKGMKGRDLWQKTIFPMTLDHEANVYIFGVPKSMKAKKDEVDESGKKHKTSLYYELCQMYKTNHKWKTEIYSSYSNPLLTVEGIKEMEKTVPEHVKEQEIYGKFINIDGKSVYKRSWFKVLYHLPPKHSWKRIIISCDTAVKPEEENDDTAAVVILETQAEFIILDMMCKKIDFVDLVNDLNTFYARNDYKWENKRIEIMLIEDKSSGSSAVQTIKRLSKLRVEPINPKGDKYVRACACSPTFKTGNVSLFYGDWNEKLISQMCEFNILMDSPDDIVDAVTQGINYLENRDTGKPNYKNIL